MSREQNDSSFLGLIYSFISSAIPEKTILLTVAKMTITVTATGLVVTIVISKVDFGTGLDRCQACLLMARQKTSATTRQNQSMHEN